MVKELKIDYLPEDDFYSDIPGMGDEEMLDANVSVRGGSGGGAPTTLSFTHTAASGTGLFTFTGFGFTPSWVSITATFTALTSPETHSTGIQQGSNLAGITIKNGTSNDLGSRIVSIGDSGLSNQTRADFSQFVSDGIELNFLNADLDTKLIITCFQ